MRDAQVLAGARVVTGLGWRVSQAQARGAGSGEGCRQERDGKTGRTQVHRPLQNLPREHAGQFVVS